eukprot:g711.t1
MWPLAASAGYFFMASYSSPSSLNMSWNELHGHAKIVIVGDTGIGKTSMLKRFVNRCFDDKGTMVTIGGAFYLTKEMKVNVKRGEIVDGTLRLQICDTGGREQFKTLDRSFYQEVKLVIVAFAFGDDESAENSKMWIHEVLNCTQDIPVFLVANKSDLADEAMRKKTSNRIRDMSENEEGAAHFFEVSAKSDPKSSTKTKRFITLQICDPKRAERGDTINAAYYGDAKAVIYVGALDDDKLEENLKFNEEDTESKIDKTAYRFYVGSKKDVFDKETKEKNNMLSDVAGKLEQTYKERFYRVSSKTGEGVDTLFKDVAEAIAKSFPGKIRRKRSAKKSKSWATIGTSFLTKKVSVKDKAGKNGSLTLQICDTQRTERGDTINDAYYRDARAIIFVGALDDNDTNENLKDVEDETAMKNIDKTAIRFYVGSKKDVFDKETGKKKSELSDSAKKLQQTYKERGYRFYQVSSKTGEGVDALFKDVADAIAKTWPGKIEDDVTAKSKSWCSLM